LTMGDGFPAIKYTREKRVEGTKYFGPYTDARAARSVIDTVRRLMPICRASCPEWKQVVRAERAGKPYAATARPCFDSHIGLGPGVCRGDIDPDWYRARINRVAQFLSGQYAPLERELKAQMHEAAANLDFESAARYRNRIDALDALKDKQAVVSDSKLDVDVIGIYREETIAGVYVLIVRGGRVLNSNEFILDKGLDVSRDALISGFITKYYSRTTEIPKALVIEDSLDDQVLLEDWLTQERRTLSPRAGRVGVEVPQRGVKHELVMMATRNARHALVRWMIRNHYEDDRLNAALLQLESALALRDAPYRIECYDISTLHGTHSVGSMVVFQTGKKDAGAYRRFRIRREEGQANDVAMMREVLARRFSARNREDARFAQMPDLIIVDGGRPQLGAVGQMLEELGIEVDVVGLAKREEEVFVTWQPDPVILPDGSPSLYLMKRIRDEAHRFAIEYHRLLRSKAMTASILDEVAGIGPKKRKELVKHFGSFKKLKEATVADIEQVKGINAVLAQDVYGVLHMNDE